MASPSPGRPAGVSALTLAEGYAAFFTFSIHNFWLYLKRFLTQMCARFSPSRSAAPWEEGADALVPANQR